MDTVTESDMAIALAQEGGWASSTRTCRSSGRPKRSTRSSAVANGIIIDPVTLPADASVGQAREIMDQHNVSGVPIVGRDGKLAGIITRRDLRFLEDSDLPISEVMTARAAGNGYGDRNA